MTTVYVNGVKVRREDLKNMEIRSEQVKRILSAHLAGKERRGA